MKIKKFNETVEKPENIGNKQEINDVISRLTEKKNNATNDADYNLYRSVIYLLESINLPDHMTHSKNRMLDTALIGLNHFLNQK